VSGGLGRVLLTGAGGALGGVMARSMAAEGADLVLTTRSAAKLGALAEEVRALGRRAECIAADFTRPEEIDRLAPAAWSALGGIDGVVLSSQPAQPMLGDLLATSDQDWRDQQMAIAWGPLRLMKGLAPRMMEAGGGAIVALTSSTALEPVPGYGAYGLAKSTLWTMLLYMAAEWGPHGIRANAVCPGMIATGGTGVADAAAPPAAMIARTALRRTGSSAEVAGAVIHLVSDDASSSRKTRSM